ncbi:hypothetical protein MMC11_005463 [Xylographa trunciseda]|nr:hypothetical protein [Xylographa trunciseda]
MSDDEERETKPFKFVTAGMYLPQCRAQQRAPFQMSLLWRRRSLIRFSTQLANIVSAHQALTLDFPTRIRPSTAGRTMSITTSVS